MKLTFVRISFARSAQWRVFWVSPKEKLLGLMLAIIAVRHDPPSESCAHKKYPFKTWFQEKSQRAHHRLSSKNPPLLKSCKPLKGCGGKNTPLEAGWAWNSWRGCVFSLHTGHWCNCSGPGGNGLCLHPPLTSKCADPWPALALTLPSLSVKACLLAPPFLSPVALCTLQLPAIITPVSFSQPYTWSSFLSSLLNMLRLLMVYKWQKMQQKEKMSKLKLLACKMAWDRDDVSLMRVGSVVLLRLPLCSNVMTYTCKYQKRSLSQTQRKQTHSEIAPRW